MLLAAGVYNALVYFNARSRGAGQEKIWED